MALALVVSARRVACRHAGLVAGGGGGGRKTFLPLRALALGMAALALGCGGAPFTDFGDDRIPPPSAPPSSAGTDGDVGSDAGSTYDATVNSDEDGGGFHFVTAPPADAAGNVTTVCSAGVYQGEFMTYVGVGGDGGKAGLFSFMWNGSLTLDLAAKKITMTSTTGGEIPTTTSSTTLEIADGGALDGSDKMGGSFFADLNGELDCSPDAGSPYHLSATLSHGAYKDSFISIAIVGDLTADYQEAGAGTPPMLVNGGILVAGVLKDGGAPFASARGNWSATWVSSQ
jgi:hypothetical protein